VTRKKIVIKETERKDDLDPSKDEFVVNSMSFLDWAVERRRQIGVILATILVAAVAGILYSNYRERVASESTAMLGTQLDAWTAPILRSADESGVPTEKNPELLSFESREARATESLARVQKSITADGSDQNSQMVGIVKASALFDKGDFAGAAAGFQAFLDSSGSRGSWLEVNALEGLVSALSAAGKKDEAIKVAARLKSASQGRVSVWAQLEQARNEMLAGKTQDAATRLREIMKNLTSEGEPDALDYLFVEARAMLLALDPTAQVPDLPTGISPEILQQLLQARAAGGGAMQ